MQETDCLSHRCCLVDAKQYRSLTLRAASLALDRADLGNCVKNLARRMQQPKESLHAPIAEAGATLEVKVTRRTTFRSTVESSWTTYEMMVDGERCGEF